MRTRSIINPFVWALLFAPVAGFAQVECDQAITVDSGVYISVPERNNAAGRVKLNNQQIKDKLSVIFEDRHLAQQFAFTLLSIPRAIDWRKELANDFSVVEGDKVSEWRPWSVDGDGRDLAFIRFTKSVVISRYTPDAMEQCFVFADQNLGICLPIAHADVYESNVQAGLVARLMMSGMLRDECPGDLPDPIPSMQRLAAEHQEYFGPKGPDQWMDKGIDRDVARRNYQNLLLSNLAMSGISGTGVLQGWNLGGLILRAEPQTRSAVVALLRHRYSLRELGVLTGYSLEYIRGFASTCAAVDILKRSGQEQPSVTEISAAISSGGDLNDMGKFLRAVETAILWKGSDPSLGEESRNLHLVFAQGFGEGRRRSHDDLLANICQISYQIGYLNGYEQGRVEGFRAGWRAGYDQATKDFLKKSRKLFDGLPSKDEIDRGIKTAKEIADIAKAIAAIAA